MKKISEFTILTFCFVALGACTPDAFAPGDAGSIKDAGDVDLDSGATPPTNCGNGRVDDGEICDGDLPETSCVDLGFAAGELSCAPDCRSFAVSDCIDAACYPNPCTEANRTRCEAAGTGFFCSCDEGYTLIQDRCENVRATLCGELRENGDAFEPDDCFDSASELPTDQTQNHTLGEGTDVDWFRFDISAQVMARIEFTQQGGSGVAHLALLNADFELLDDTTVETSGVYTVEADAVTDTHFFVRVEGTDTDYQIRLQRFFDDHGDSVQDATLASPGTISGEIELPFDSDWFQIPCDETKIITVRVLAGGPRTLSLHTDSGQVWRQNTAAGWIAASCQSEEAFWLRVGGEVGTYEISVSLEADDASSMCAEATPMTGQTTGTFHYTADRDCYSIQALANHGYVVAFSDAPMLSGKGVWNQVLNLNYDANAAGNYLLKSNVETTLCLCVVAKSEYLEQTYQIEVTSLGLDDHGDDFMSATDFVPDGTPVTGIAHGTDDPEWFRFPVEAKHWYRGEPPQSASFSFGFSADGDPNDIHRRPYFRASETGYAYATFEISNYTTPYEFSVTDMGFDPEGESADDATDLIIGPNLHHARINDVDDQDWYQFSPFQTGNYTLTINTDWVIRASVYKTENGSLRAIEEDLTFRSSTPTANVSLVADQEVYVQVERPSQLTTSFDYEIGLEEILD